MKRIGLMLVLLVQMGVFGCSPQQGYEAQNVDVPAATDKNLIIIGSNLAEIVVSLDAHHTVVGIGGGADHITALNDVPVIPGFRNTSAENMLSLSPDIALLSGRQTRPEIVEQLKMSGVDVHVFTDDAGSIDAVVEKITRIGDILNKQQKATTLVERFRAELEDAKGFIAQATSKPKGLFILSGGGRPTLVAGEDTDIALLLSMAGAQNMTDGIKGFKPMSQEKMLAAAPEFVLINKEGKTMKGDVPVALTAPGVLMTPAGQNKKIITLPSGYLTGLGINTPAAIVALGKLIHPELAVSVEHDDG